MRRLLPLLALGLLLLPAGCSRRERANPFDPRNPNSSGRPSGFMALAGDHQVTLRWNSVQGPTLLGYQVFRRGPGETDYTPISGTLDAFSTTYRDIVVVNGFDFEYRLYFVFASGLGSLPAEDVATPGTAIPWLVENGGTDLMRITPDNRRVSARLTEYAGTADVATNPVTGDVWVADPGADRVAIFKPYDGITVSVPGFALPRAIAVDGYDGSAWVCDQGGSIVHVSADGTNAPFSFGPINQPMDVAVDQFAGSVWVVERGDNRIARYDAGQQQWFRPVPAPSRVAVDSTTQEGWVTSFTTGTLTHITSTGLPVGAPLELTSPLGVCVDHRRGRIWVADPGAGQLVAVRRDGSVEFRVTGLADVGDVAVDLTTGEAWAVLGVGGRLTRVSPAGTVIRTQSGFQSPFAISVDPGGR
jgi:DNA-binding beta-propeller fold protein YncE